MSLSDKTIDKWNKMVSNKDFKDIVDMYPETMNEMVSLITDNLVTFAKKQKDYGPYNVLINNDKELSLLALSVRQHDKIQRILNLLTNDQEPQNESLEDSFLDLANYALMSVILLRGSWSK